MFEVLEIPVNIGVLSFEIWVYVWVNWLYHILKKIGLDLVFYTPINPFKIVILYDYTTIYSGVIP